MTLETTALRSVNHAPVVPSPPKLWSPTLAFRPTYFFRTWPRGNDPVSHYIPHFNTSYDFVSFPSSFLHYPILGSHSRTRDYGFSSRGVDDYDTAPPPTSWESTALRENYYLKTSRRMTTILWRNEYICPSPIPFDSPLLPRPHITDRCVK